MKNEGTQGTKETHVNRERKKGRSAYCLNIDTEALVQGEALVMGIKGAFTRK